MRSRIGGGVNKMSEIDCITREIILTFDAQEIRVNRITNVQWWTRILSPVSILYFFDTPPKKRGEIKQNTGLYADTSQKLRRKCRWMRNKNIPAFDLLQIFFAIRKKVGEET